MFILLLPIYSSNQNLEMPYALVSTVEERNSPSDWIKEEQIKVYSNKIIIDIESLIKIFILKKIFT